MVYNYCKWCTNKKFGIDCDSFASLCPILTEVWDLIEAAEFESRVAIVLAQFAETNAFDCPTCPLGFDCTKESEDFCVWRILKEARLTVEAEMDK